MRLWNRVIISVLRRKTASLVLLLVTFLLGNVLAVSLSIKQSSQSVKDNLYDSIGGKITLTSDAFDPSKLNHMSENEYLNTMNKFYELYGKLVNREIVKYGDYSLHAEYITLDESYQVQLPNYVGDYSKYSLLHGIQNERLIDEISGKLTLIDGERFTKEQMQQGANVILVSNQVKIDGKEVKVGDKLDFRLFYETINKYSQYEMEYSDVIEYEVIGIYQPVINKYSSSQNYVFPFYVPNQNILNLQKMMDEIKINSEKRVSGNYRYFIYSSIIEASSAKELDLLIYAANTYKEKYKFQYESTESFVSQFIGPIETFSTISNNVFIFSMIATVIIVGLISFYFIRDRKYEVGIYLSLGIKKYKLCLQIIMETLLVGLLGLMLSCGSGYFISQKYSDLLLDTVIKTSNEEKDKYTIGMSMIDPNNISSDDLISQYEIVIEVEDVVYLFGMNSITLILSSIFPLVYIMNLKPKNILLE